MIYAIKLSSEIFSKQNCKKVLAGLGYDIDKAVYANDEEKKFHVFTFAEVKEGEEVIEEAIPKTQNCFQVRGIEKDEATTVVKDDFVKDTVGEIETVSNISESIESIVAPTVTESAFAEETEVKAEEIKQLAQDAPQTEEVKAIEQEPIKAAQAILEPIAPIVEASKAIKAEKPTLALKIKELILEKEAMAISVQSISLDKQDLVVKLAKVENELAGIKKERDTIKGELAKAKATLSNPSFVIAQSKGEENPLEDNGDLDLEATSYFDAYNKIQNPSERVKFWQDNEKAIRADMAKQFAKRK